MMKRRHFLASAGASLAALPRPAFPAELPRLHHLAAQGGRVFGSCSAGLITWDESGPVLGADQAHLRLFLDQCGVLTTEREFKMKRLRPTPNEWEWRAVDLLAELARRHGLMLRGHTLVWHESMPDWWESEPHPEARLVEHIATVCSRMGEQVHTWDVVNEPVEGDGLRPTPLLAQLGPRYIELAFRTARQAAPKARLCLNEYGLEYATAEDETKRRALLKLLRQLLDAGVPVDMVGIQGHLHPNERFRPNLFARFLEELRGLGLSVMITELDVNDRHLPANPYTRDRWVARELSEYLAVALAEPAVTGVVCWGIADRYSWLSEAPGARRWDGLRSRGTLFDENLRPKPAFRAVAQALTPGEGRG